MGDGLADFIEGREKFLEWLTLLMDQDNKFLLNIHGEIYDRSDEKYIKIVEDTKNIINMAKIQLKHSDLFYLTDADPYRNVTRMCASYIEKIPKTFIAKLPKIWENLGWAKFNLGSIHMYTSVRDLGEETKFLEGLYLSEIHRISDRLIKMIMEKCFKDVEIPEDVKDTPGKMREFYNELPKEGKFLNVSDFSETDIKDIETMLKDSECLRSKIGALISAAWELEKDAKRAIASKKLEKAAESAVATGKLQSEK